MNTTTELPASVLTKTQTKSFGPVEYREDGRRYRVRAEVRYDDSCGNGHNTFSITGVISEFRGRRFYDVGWGQVMEQISKHIPKLRPLLKWHLCSSDGPMHYVANTIYHVKEGNFDYARLSAIWPEITDADLAYEPDVCLKARLLERLPALMQEFKAAVESLGFVY